MSDQNPGQPYGSQPYGSQPYGGQPSGEQPYAQQPDHGQPPYAQQPYAQQPYGGQYAGGYSMAPKTNTMALVSLISSILGFTAVPFLGSIVAIITGHMALRQIRDTGEGGAGLAKAGLIIGYVVVALTVLLLVGSIAFFAAFPWETVTTAP